MKLPLRLRILITAIVLLLVWGHIAWDYFHGGIPTHYLLQDDDMPGIPNWLGGIVLPFFTWFLLYRIHKRIDNPEPGVVTQSLRTVILRFLAAAFVAIAISVCFIHDVKEIDYILGAVLVLAFFFPIYKSEYLLGWVLGASFTFGAIIPMGFGSIFALVFFIFYTLPRKLIGFFKKPKQV